VPGATDASIPLRSTPVCAAAGAVVAGDAVALAAFGSEATGTGARAADEVSAGEHAPTDANATRVTRVTRAADERRRMAPHRLTAGARQRGCSQRWSRRRSAVSFASWTSTGRRPIQKGREFARQKGLGWVVRTLAAMAGLREDEGIAKRYRDLVNAPEGSLGRGYVDFITANGFSFPGEKGSPPETIALHDLTHVLSGYGTDPEGELQVLGFHAGCRREDNDPFSFLMFGIAEFHLGVAMSPVATGSRGKLDPVLLFRAIERGRSCTVDPTEGWDPWPLMHEPLASVRARYGITPIS